MTKSEIQKTVHLILRKGIQSGSNVIHIEQDCEGPKLRYRLNGVLKALKQEWFGQHPSEMLKGVIFELKSMAGLDPREKSMPQNGILNADFLDREGKNGGDLYFTVSTCPAVFGETVTLRRLHQYSEDQELSENQHATHVYEPFEKLLDQPEGVILVAGPADSRKTSTIYSALRWLHHPGIKIITAEDPIAYSLPGIMQTQVNPGRDLGYAKLVHAFLKLDPDVIFIGAMDEKDSARKGFEVAQSQHLVLGTVQSNDALNAISQLRRLGLDNTRIVANLLGILSQLSVKRICQSCIKKYRPDETEWRILFDTFPSNLIFYKGKGCEECHFTGYRGRIVLSELLSMDESLSRAIAGGADEKTIRELALAGGMKTIIDDGLMKLNHTTLSEIITNVPHDVLKAHVERSRSEEKADSTVMSVAISDPDSEKEEITRLYDKYADLAEESGAGEGRGDAALFFEFVSENFKKISTQKQCGTVVFSVVMGDDGARLNAVPE
jgi:type IV pilus assembly protein PilB